MAGRPKSVWLAGIRSIGRTFLSGTGMCIHIRLRLEREQDRDVSIHLSLSEAEKWRDALTHFIDKTKEGK